MIIGHELRAWATDPGLQRRTRAAADALAISWSSGEVHRRFAGAMAALPGRSAEAVVATLGTLFAEDEWTDSLIGTLAEAMRADPFIVPPFRHLDSDIHTGLIVFEDDNMSVAAGVSGAGHLAAKKSASRDSTSIVFSGQVSVFKFIRAGEARLSFWEAPRIEADFSAAAAGKCACTGDRIIDDGEILVVDGRRQSFVIEHAGSNLVILQASVKHDRGPVSVEYDSRTREYVGCSAADDSASRIQMITTLLRKLDCDEAFPAIAAFLDHPHFFVRWHVMRELLGIDADAALPHLKRMAARDPHREVRRTARTLLDGIEGGMPRKAAA